MGHTLQNPKYSIIIPSRNGGKYLPHCVTTIINQEYDNYELILSDDHSTDGTSAYLSAIVHPNVTVIQPPEELSMTEHWEWALSHAYGEWLIFVGQDDGLQPYFFRLADRLTEIANKANLRTIMSERAYFFWQDCEFVYGDVAVEYHARNATKFHNCRYEAIKALIGLQAYFNLPEMYTTSLFHRDIISEAKRKQQSRLFLTHPQDANLAAIACSLEDRYLMSSIPLGWVGSSLKSAGMAVGSQESSLDASEKSNALNSLKKEYVGKINKSALEYNYLAGDFLFGNVSIYFWQAFLQTQNLRGSLENRILKSKLFKAILFCRVLNEVNSSGNSALRLPMFKEILKRNQCSFVLINLGSKVSSLIAGIILLSGSVIRKVLQMLSSGINYTVAWSDDASMDMLKASSQVNALINKKKWLN
jgi:glycosyltransferase involved in cell wall biosynthesis